MLKYKTLSGDAIYIAYYNSYLVYSGRLTVDEIVQTDKNARENSFFMHNPSMDVKMQSDDAFNGFIDTLIEYFSSIERFEICNELKMIKR